MKRTKTSPIASAIAVPSSLNLEQDLGLPAQLEIEEPEDEPGWTIAIMMGVGTICLALAAMAQGVI